MLVNLDYDISNVSNFKTGVDHMHNHIDMLQKN